MIYTLEIQKLLNKASYLDDKNKDKIKYFLQAIQLADDNQDIEWAYELRMQLMDIEWEHTDRKNFLPTFSWLLNAYDASPDEYDVEELLWKYKWIISEVQSNPEISLAHMNNIMDDFKRRSELEGYNLRAYHSKLLHEAAEQMDVEKSLYLQSQINLFPRDGISDCQACELDSEVLTLLQDNNFEEGLNKAQPILQEQYTCARVPLVTRVNIAYHALINGQPDIAQQYLDRVIQELSEREEDTYLISSLGDFMPVIFALKPESAWNYVEQFIPWTLDTDKSTRFFFARGMAEALSQKQGGETVTLNIPPSHALYRPENTYTVDEIYTYYLDKAKLLAKQFDLRNENNNFTNQIKTR
ncbi:hypothetical protein ACR777_19570 [Sphingobacterium spiritivorum]|uniref:hypothetical protein n=1 Tax=Sphingobacterium spiritivorum TaxID=258 RepID=UPI003DA4A7F6